MIGQLPLVKTILAGLRNWRALRRRLGSGVYDHMTAARTDLKTEDQLKMMQQQFDRAITFSKGKHASAYVSFAEKQLYPRERSRRVSIHAGESSGSGS